MEKLLLPEGFTISVREKVFDEERNLIAEFDLIVSGKLGSTHIKWLIECRDRPSKGAAPGEWIEQLAGRRDRFGFNKVTAVSTTGFSPGAMDWAKQSGIELRTLNEINVDVIQDWCKVTEMQVTNAHGLLQSAAMFLDPEPSEKQSEKLRDILNNPGEPFLVNTGTGEEISLNDTWRAFLNQSPQVFENIAPNSEPKRLRVVANYTNPESRYKIVLGEDEFHLVQIEFVADLTVQVHERPIAAIKEYGKVFEREAISQSVHFEVEDGKETVDLALHRVEGDSGTYFFASRAPTKPSKKRRKRPRNKK